MKKNLRINRVFNIENGLILILIFSLVIVFSLEISQSKAEAGEINNESINNNDTEDSKPILAPTPTKPEVDVEAIEIPVTEDIIEPIPEDNKSDSESDNEPEYTEPIWYPEDDSSNDWIPPSNNTVDSPVVKPPAVDPPVVNPPVVDPPVVKPPAVKPPVVKPPVIDPPAVDPPVVEPPAVDPPVVEPPIVEPPAVNHSTFNKPVYNDINTNL